MLKRDNTDVKQLFNVIKNESKGVLSVHKKAIESADYFNLIKPFYNQALEK